jgi:hypothetical protein
MLELEQKRIGRSEARFILLLIHHVSRDSDPPETGQALVAAVTRSTRATDIVGWHHEGRVLGVICTEVGTTEDTHVMGALEARIIEALRSGCAAERQPEIRMNAAVFPGPFGVDDESTDSYGTSERRALRRRAGVS